VNHRRPRDQRGGIALMAAISMVAVCAAGAVAVDLGKSWSDRRELITGTDAAALAAAQRYAIGQSGCVASTEALVSTNAPGATMTGCSATGSARSGSVTVDGSQSVSYVFAPVIGKTNGQVEASTTAKWGIPLSLSGLRPFGLCVDSSPQITALVRNGVMPTGNITITYGKSQPAACGGSVPGNWGMIDFNGGSNSNAETNEWVRNGYPDPVTAGTLGAPCAAEPTACYPGDTGAYSNSLSASMSTLVASGEAFALPVFDSATGNGSNSSFHLVAFVFIKLIDFRTTGSQATRFLTIRVSSGIAQGTCCVTNPGVIDTGLRVVKLCATDATDKTAC